MTYYLYLIFYKTYDNLCVLSANFYNDVDEGILDFHRMYVFLNYQLFLDVIKQEFSSVITKIDDNDENVRNFTLKFKVPNIQQNTKTYIKSVLNKINEHPNSLIANAAYQFKIGTDDIFELYFNSAKTLICDIEWLNK